MSGRVLVTGASGLIGQHLPAMLESAGYETLLTTRRAQDGGDGRYVELDLLDGPAVSKAMNDLRPSHLLHLAWHDGGVDRWNGMANVDWIAATTHLVQSFAEAGGKRVVAAGSCAEYDWSFEVLKETTPLRPSSLYGKAKASTGTHLIEMSRLMGLSLAWARIFFCYGPHEPRGRLLGDLIYGLASGNEVPCSDGEQIRDYLHTADVARALVAVMESSLEGAVNVASGKETRVKDIIRILGEIFDRRDLLRIGALTRPVGDPPRLIGAADKLAEIGFVPTYDLRSGLLNCVEETAPHAATAFQA